MNAPQSKQIRIKKLAIFLAFTVLVTLAIATLWPTRSKKISQSPTLVYSEQIGEEKDFRARTYPVIKIYKQIVGSQPENLITAGNASKQEYPNNTILSPNGRFLGINLESKLLVMDLQTKKIDTILPQRSFYNGFAFSPDSTKIFIWDQFYVKRNVADDGRYFAHIYSIVDHKDVVIFQSQDETGPYFVKTWRGDNYVVMGEARGDWAPIFYFDLNQNKLKPGPKNYSLGSLSSSGKIMAVPNTTIGSVCNAVSASEPETYQIIDPVSGNKISKVGKEGFAIGIEAFSLDDSQVLYSSFKSDDKNIDCQGIVYSHYVENLQDHTIHQVANPDKIKNAWKGNSFIAVVRETGYRESWTLVVNGQEAKTSTGEIKIIGQIN